MEEISRLVPLFQVVPIFVLLLSFLFLREVLSFQQMAGFFIILAGAILISIEKYEWGVFRLREAFWYMMLSSFLFAVPLVIFKFVSLSSGSFFQTLGWEFHRLYPLASRKLLCYHACSRFPCDGPRRRSAISGACLWCCSLPVDSLRSSGRHASAYHRGKSYHFSSYFFGVFLVTR